MLVPQMLVFLAILFVFRLEAIMVAAELLEQGQEGVPLRPYSRMILLDGFQPGAQPVVLLLGTLTTGGQLGIQALHLIAQPSIFVAQRLTFSAENQDLIGR